MAPLLPSPSPHRRQRAPLSSVWWTYRWPGVFILLFGITYTLKAPGPRRGRGAQEKERKKDVQKRKGVRGKPESPGILRGVQQAT
jgi:hypothetical protein